MVCGVGSTPEWGHTTGTAVNFIELTDWPISLLETPTGFQVSEWIVYCYVMQVVNL